MPVTHPLSQSEFADLLEANFKPLWCIAAAVLADRCLADDVVQEAALIGLRKLGEFQRGTSFAAWMGQIVRNVARNHARRRLRAGTVHTDTRTIDVMTAAERTMPPTPLTSDGRLRDDQESFDDQVLAALDALSETARACLLLRTVLDTPYQEISRLLNIPGGTAMSHVHRARHEMRRRLEAGDLSPKEAPRA